MNNWLKSLLAGLVMAVIAFFLSGKILQRRKTELYTAHYILGSKPSAGMTPEEIGGELPAIIKRRINELGYESILRVKEDNRLDLLVKHVRDTSLIQKKIQCNRKIEFREVYTLDELPLFYKTADKVTDKLHPSRDGQDLSLYSLISPLVPDETTGHTRFPPAIGATNKKDTEILSNILRHPALLKSVPGDARFYYGILTEES